MIQFDFSERRDSGKSKLICVTRRRFWEEPKYKAINRPPSLPYPSPWISVEFVSMTGENFWEASDQGARVASTCNRAVAVQPDAVTKKSIDRPTSRSFLRSRLRRSACPLELRSISPIETRKNHLSAVTRGENLSRRATLRAIRNAWITREQERKENVAPAIAITLWKHRGLLLGNNLTKNVHVIMAFREKLLDLGSLLFLREIYYEHERV